LRLIGIDEGPAEVRSLPMPPAWKLSGAVIIEFLPFPRYSARRSVKVNPATVVVGLGRNRAAESLSWAA